ncbi:MAG: hypothetical protein K8R18_16595 [Parvibaculum sp.]|uniref:hypothetical protein n=1 Tax=Parvibaculum sp. TaxID=2024848 RepID=UPI0025FE63A1|nr:hypothetical protein [Parvibaculum sp.]MCE9651240.1 hypothetical protein [Parvibaculum sp.]
MLTKADDYPIHQLPEPIAYAGTDRNFYDRYFFNGYSPDGAVFFAAALGVYPALNVMDGAFCVVDDGVQHNLRVSRVLGMERMDTRVGPLSVEVVEPLRSLRVRVDKHEHGIAADLTFHMRAEAIEEPRFTYRQGPRTIMDYTRLTQNGSYEGWIEIRGKRIEVKRDRFLGTRDRSWGIRPVGARDSQPVAPPPPSQFYWIWAPMNFEDRITLYHNNADGEGRPWNTHAVMAPTAAGAATHMASCSSDIAFKSGTRHARAATIRTVDEAGNAYRLELEPQWNFYMSGLGYTHPEWGHGHYRGALAIGYDVIETAKVNESEMHFLHVQAFSKATLTGSNGLERKGHGVLEQLIIGPHKPSGFAALSDGAK